jgi:hypothetical protein
MCNIVGILTQFVCCSNLSFDEKFEKHFEQMFFKGTDLLLLYSKRDRQQLSVSFSCNIFILEDATCGTQIG